jgi:hypothetical protein
MTFTQPQQKHSKQKSDERKRQQDQIDMDAELGEVASHTQKNEINDDELDDGLTYSKMITTSTPSTTSRRRYYSVDENNLNTQLYADAAAAARAEATRQIAGENYSFFNSLHEDTIYDSDEALSDELNENEATMSENNESNNEENGLDEKLSNENKASPTDNESSTQYMQSPLEQQKQQSKSDDEKLINSNLESFSLRSSNLKLAESDASIANLEKTADASSDEVFKQKLNENNSNNNINNNNNNKPEQFANAKSKHVDRFGEADVDLELNSKMNRSSISSSLLHCSSSIENYSMNNHPKFQKLKLTDDAGSLESNGPSNLSAAECEQLRNYINVLRGLDYKGEYENVARNFISCGHAHQSEIKSEGKLTDGILYFVFFYLFVHYRLPNRDRLLTLLLFCNSRL